MGDHGRRPAGGDGQASSPSPAPRNARADLAGADYLSPSRASAARAASHSSRNFRTRNSASRSTPRTATTAPTRCRASGSPRSSRRLSERSRLEQADRSRARGALPAGQGQADRLCRRPERRHGPLSRERPERPGPLCPRLCLASRRLSRQSPAEADACSPTAPDDPYFLELKGQILLESGKPDEALEPLREAVKQAPDQPLIAAMLGHALIATEKPANFEEAKQVLKARGQPRQRQSLRLVPARHRL